MKAAEPTASLPNRSRTDSIASSSARRSSVTGPGPSKSSRPCTPTPSSSCCTDTPSRRMPSSRSTGAQQRAGRVTDLGGQVRRGRQGVRSGDRAEVAEAHLQLHGPRGLRGPAQAHRDRVGHAQRVPLEPVEIGPVLRERLLVPDRLEHAVRLDRPVVAVPGQRVQMCTGRRAEARARASPPAARARSPTVFTRCRSSRFLVAGPTPQSRVTGSGWRNSSSVPGSTTSMPSGFAMSLASFASSFVVAAPTDAVSPVSARIRRRSNAPISGPVPSDRRAPATSRNASSTEIGSTSGVTSCSTP